MTSILKKYLNLSFSFTKGLPLIFQSQMAEEVWTTSYPMDAEGFPKLLYATMVRLGILDRPEYVGREYEEYGTERCE